MESHREPKWCCVSSLTKIVTFFAVPFWSMPVLPRPPAPGQHAPGRDGYAPQHNADRPWRLPPLLDDEHVAAHGACQVVGGATPNMLIDPGMSGEADHQQIDGILLNEIANYPDGMSGHNYGLNVHRMHRRARPAMLGKLPEVAIGAILLFTQLVDHFGVVRDLLLDANHAQMRAQPGRQLDRHIEGLSGVVGTVVCN